VDWTRLRELVSDPTTPVQPDAPDISAAVVGLARPGVGKHPDIAATLLVDAEASSELGNWQSFGDLSVPVKSVRGRIGLTEQQVIDFADGVSTTLALLLMQPSLT